MKLLYRSLIFLALISLIAVSCQRKPKMDKLEKDKPVAKVYDKYLMLSDLKKVIPDNLSPEDSSYEAENYINKWIRKQLLVNMAENYLKDEKPEIDKKVEAFRQSLLIHTFKNKIVAEKLDTAISADEIAQYYEAHKDEFILNQPVIQGYFIKLPLDKADAIDEIKSLTRYNLPENINKAQEIVKKNQGVFIDFRNKWKYFSEVLMMIPYSVNNPEYFLQNHRYIETDDDHYYYYLRITDFILSKETMPLELCSDQIRKILINERGEKVFQDIENKLYTDGIKKGNVKIFY